MIVKTWTEFYLHDDLAIRQDIPEFEKHVQTYSLFKINPNGTFSRVRVFAGSLDWAMNQAEQFINNLLC